MYKVVTRVWRAEGIERIKFECCDLLLAKKFASMVFHHSHGGSHIEVELTDDKDKVLSWY